MHPWRIVVMTLGLVTAASAAALQDEGVTAWVRTHAIPLTTVEANNGFNDLQPLKSLIGNARIVSLGEATHGSREIFQLKHRMVEFLASEMGFTIFSIEANMPEAYRLNDYVLNGTGDPAQLLRGMYFWTWDTEEVLTMIKWMRAFNQSGKGRIEFTGFDMQTPTVALDLARQFLAGNDPAYLAAFAEAASLIAKSNASVRAFGVATGTFPVRVAAGKKVRFSHWLHGRPRPGGRSWRHAKPSHEPDRGAGNGDRRRARADCSGVEGCGRAPGNSEARLSIQGRVGSCD